MSYKKGKDIKCPFDCLFHYFTRKFELVSGSKEYGNTLFFGSTEEKPEEFDKW